MKGYFVFMLVGIFILTFLAGNVEAASWDNIKEYEKDPAPYGRIVEYNSIIPLIIKGNKIAEYTLDYNVDSVINAEAGGTVILYEPSVIFEKFSFKDKWNRIKNVSYRIYYNVSEAYTEDQFTYKEICEIKTEINGTVNSCKQIINTTTTITKYREIMKVYNGEVLPAGVYKWKIEAKKPYPNYALDWGFKARSIDEDYTRSYWAWWNGSWEKRKK